MATQAGSTLATATQASPSAPDLPPGSKHGFFKTLLRELRDQIYDFLVHEVEWRFGQAYDGFACHITAPLVALRLVSHHFKLEYDKRCSLNEHMSQLLIKEVFIPTFQIDCRCPALATHTTNMTLTLSICSGFSHCPSGKCYVGMDLQRYQHWINIFADQLPYLRWVRVNLKVTRSSCAQTLLQFLSRFAMQPKAVELKLLKAGRGFVENYKSNNMILATWTRHRGLEGDDEVVKQYLERASVAK